MEAALLLLSSLVVLVVPMGNVEVEVVVRLGIVSLVKTLIVAVVIISWFIVGIYPRQTIWVCQLKFFVGGFIGHI